MDLEKTTISIYQNAKPSVVHVTALTEQPDAFGLNMQEVPADTGTGFIWRADGYIVTNYHVVQNAVEGGGGVQVTLADQTSAIDAAVVGYYPDKDIAVLRITPPLGKTLTPIPLGKSADLQVGQSVFAIGNPFGLDLTLTTGVVSATGREIQSVTKHPMKNVIQTDAAINPGNSGGPLLDIAGRLIGMNTAIYSPSGTSAGIGFAIPADEINRVAPADHQARRANAPTSDAAPRPGGVLRSGSADAEQQLPRRDDRQRDAERPGRQGGLAVVLGAPAAARRHHHGRGRQAGADD